ncbi:MAG: PDZ domain-containing protein [Spirochaetales bacterium]|nr:PDZ domain-containing protein [Spirochaetales bacterium]
MRYSRIFRTIFLAAGLFFAAVSISAQETQEIDPELAARIAEITIQEVVADFDTVAQTISTSYVDEGFGGVEWESLVTEYRPRIESAKEPEAAYGLLEELIERLGNEMTYVVPPWFRPRQTEESDDSEDTGIELEYAGVGIMLQQMTTGDVWVVQVFSETPAEKSGVLLGDIVAGVDGWRVPVEDAVSQIASRVRGPVGTDVTLTLRDPDGSERDVPITRGRIDLRPSVEFRTVDGSIGYLRIPSITEELVDEASKALPKLLQTRYLILDLRNVSGGGIEAMSRVAQWFIGAAQLGGFVSRDGAFGLPFREDAVATYQRPIAVLMNSGTYGIGEILGTILHDYKRARLVGNTSDGGFHLYQTVELPSGGALIMTIGLYVTPKGDLLPINGIEPDNPVELPDLATVRSGKDVYLDAAIDILRNNPRL